MNTQIITTPAGEELAVLPKAELDALIEALEDYADNAIFDRIQASQTPEEGFPQEVVSRLVDGINPVRVFREYRNLSATELAQRAGISGAYLSQIETGAREGTGSTLKKLAKALGVDVDLLLWG